jgi:hypothetical protein
MRIPEEIRAAVQAWPGRWEAVEISGEGLQVRHYHRGEAVAMYTSDGPGDYYLWSVTRQVRLREWETARELWADALAALKRGPDRFGLVRLS